MSYKKRLIKKVSAFQSLGKISGNRVRDDFSAVGGKKNWSSTGGGSGIGARIKMFRGRNTRTEFKLIYESRVPH